MKRVFLAFAISAAALLGFEGGTALACTGLGMDPHNARAGDTVTYTVTGCSAGDTYEVRLVRKYTGGDGNPAEDTRLVADGVANDSGTNTDTFVVPDLGTDSTERAVRLSFGIPPTPLPDYEGSFGFTYLGQALPTGPTGPTTPAGTTGGVDVPAAVVPVPTVTPKEAKKETKKTTKKKSTSNKNKSKSKSKSKSNSDNGSSTPTTPTTPSYTPPATSTPAPVTATPTPTDGIKPPTTAVPPTTPPGIQGPDGTNPVIPPPTEPAPPATSVPVAPVVTSSGDSNGSPVPVWLVILLGLVAIGGLGGAQARLLGLWGPAVPLNGPDTTDARLLALQRVSQSGASFQKRIAELKKAAREREPVG